MFANTFDSAQSIYDILLIAYINLKNSGIAFTDIQEEYNNSYSNNKYKIMEKQISGYAEGDQRKSDIPPLKSSLESCFKDTELKAWDYFAIILSIDRFCPYKYIKVQPFLKSSYCLNSLSSISPEFKLFPVIEETIISKINNTAKIYDKKRHPKNSKFGIRPANCIIGAEINRYLKRYVFFQVSIYNPILHYYTDNNMFSDRIKSKSTLDIAVFPVICKKTNEIFDRTEHQSTFTIDDILPAAQEAIYKKYEQSLELCNQSKIDIAIFPEMVLTQHIISDISQLHHTYPGMMIAGSYWKDKRNVSYVYASNGEYLFEQHKKTTFKYKNKSGKEFEEHLVLDNKEVHILDINGVGRFFVYICIDMNNENLLNLVRELHGNLVLLPAYSKSLDLKSASEDLASRTHCLTVMANACAAINNHIGPEIGEDELLETKIGYVSYPAKLNSNRLGKSITYSRNIFCHNCNLNCNGRKICIKLGEACEKKGVLSPVIEISETL